MTAPSGSRPAGTGRLVTGVAWALLLLGLWLWGREVTEGPGGSSAPTTGDIAAVGRPLGVPLPPARDPLDPVAPRRVEIPSLGIAAPVVARGLDRSGAIGPPAVVVAHTVGGVGAGARPGGGGAGRRGGRGV
ncbi:class F sortase, partial [Streptomyces sp. NPDC059556]